MKKFQKGKKIKTNSIILLFHNEFAFILRGYDCICEILQKTTQIYENQKKKLSERTLIQY